MHQLSKARLVQIAEEFAVKATIKQLVVKVSRCPFPEGVLGLM
jgi:hypothetical protein